MPNRNPRAGAALALLAILAAAPDARAADPVAEARSLLGRDDPRGAVDLLERALESAPEATLPAILDLLRSSYEPAAAKAEAKGDARAAKHYRESLGLLIPEPEPAPEAKPPSPASEASEEPPAPKPEPAAPKPEAEAKPAPDSPDPRSELARADAAWTAEDYLRAGSIYAGLAKAEALPEKRRDHWAYCRLVAVLERINAGPKSPAEWSEIHAEIDHIRLLSPRNWYGEYLRNVVVERSGGVRRPDPSRVVVRGSAPDEPARPAPAPTPAPAARKPEILRAQAPADRLPPADEPPAAATAAPLPTPAPVGRAGPAHGRWKTWITPNFRIFHDDEELAKKCASRAEQVRREAAARWGGAEPRGAWTPTCDLYLYPSAEIFAKATGQPAESPGFSTAGLAGGRVTARVVKLRADHPKLVEAVLPHEVTHIVLADVFPDRQIPRWADEGMAVLSEPAPEQTARARDLAGPLRTGAVFRLDVLMTTDYPGGSHWAVFYAQSVSLTKYLAGLGTPAQFVRFVKESQVSGADAALRKTYRIDGVADLEGRWAKHAQGELNPATASAAPDADAATTRR